MIDPKLQQAQNMVIALRERLMMDGGEPHYVDCCEYSDTLVNPKGEPRFGNLSRLEWMLRTVVGHSRRQEAYIKKLLNHSTEVPLTRERSRRAFLRDSGVMR